MSYPPGPDNPYGEQPPQQPYGYPQQPPQGQPQQPGYGYPAYPQQAQQQPGYDPYGGGYGGYPGMPPQMPGKVKATRVILFILAGLQLIVGLLGFAAGAALSSTDTASQVEDQLGYPMAVYYAIMVYTVIVAIITIVIAAQFRKGGNGIRIAAIVLGALNAAGSVANLPQGILGIAIGVLVIVFMANSESAAWFKRPRP